MTLVVFIRMHCAKRNTSSGRDSSCGGQERDDDTKHTEIEIDRLDDDVPMQETIRRHNEMVETKVKAMEVPLDEAHNPALAEYCSGGWGYTKDTAVVINLGDDFRNKDAVAVHLEYQFAERRVYEELRMYGDVEGKKIDMHCIRRKFLGQSFRMIDGRAYDVLNYIVTGFPEERLEMLEKDYECHDGYKDDPDGLSRHNEMADRWRIGYKTEYWFDITSVFQGHANE